MSRILIVYATREGQTAKVANRIAGCLTELGAQVELANARDKKRTAKLDVSDYDLLIFGASLHAGSVEPELLRFIRRNAAQIELKPRTMFLLLLSAASEDVEQKATWLADARRKIDQQLPIGFCRIEMIAGALTYSKYPFPVKWLMKWIAGRAGADTNVSEDYEYTDWEQVERYAQNLLAQDDMRSFHANEDIGVG